MDQDWHFRVLAVFLVLWGGFIIFLGATMGIAWLGFCFGSIIIGVLLLIFALPILFLPFGLCTDGLAIFCRGINMFVEPGRYKDSFV
jgi:hypothetical protein